MNNVKYLVLYLSNEDIIRESAKRGDTAAARLCAAFTIVRDSNLRKYTTEGQMREFGQASEAYWQASHA